jgi:hypothetical protein
LSVNKHTDQSMYPVVNLVDTRGGGTRYLYFKVVYNETIKRESKIKPNSECRCDERLESKVEESTRLSDTGLFGELEHPKIKTRLTDEKFASVMGECDVNKPEGGGIFLHSHNKIHAVILYGKNMDV